MGQIRLASMLLIISAVIYLALIPMKFSVPNAYVDFVNMIKLFAVATPLLFSAAALTSGMALGRGRVPYTISGTTGAALLLISLIIIFTYALLKPYFFVPKEIVKVIAILSYTIFLAGFLIVTFSFLGMVRVSAFYFIAGLLMFVQLATLFKCLGVPVKALLSSGMSEGAVALYKALLHYQGGVPEGFVQLATISLIVGTVTYVAGGKGGGEGESG